MTAVCFAGLIFVGDNVIANDKQRQSDVRESISRDEELTNKLIGTWTEFQRELVSMHKEISIINTNVEILKNISK